MKNLAPLVVALSASALALIGCATTETPHQPAAGASSSAESSAAPSARVTQVATTPLSDLNLVRAEIPPVLQAAQKAPYAPLPDPTCRMLATEIAALDDALGPDLDAPASSSDPGLVARGADAFGNATVGALQRTVEGVIPFRGWVRKLTGAERYSKGVAAAIAAGTVRRAFLKGVAQAGDCAVATPPLR